MRHRYEVLPLLLVVLLAVGIAGCKKKGVETIPAAPAPTEPARPDVDEKIHTMPRTEVQDPGFRTETPDTEQIAEPTIAELNRRGVLRTVYFAFDRSDLTSDATAALRENAEWLKANSKYNVVIEGHCDERGTIEYNLTLGERRAGTVRDYLTNLGVARSRMRVVTYGEERPVDRGHDESSWSRNRRAAFVVER